MEQISKKHIILLTLTISIMMVLMLCVHVLAGFANFDVSFVRSGTFVNVHQVIHCNGWTFSADEASGHNTIFVYVSQEQFESFLKFEIVSLANNGEMWLTISQSGISHRVELNNSQIKATTLVDIDTSMFRYGRFEMQLTLASAANVFVDIEW